MQLTSHAHAREAHLRCRHYIEYLELVPRDSFWACKAFHTLV